MTRRGERDRGKERFWRGVLRRWRHSGLSVRDFCAAQGVSEPSFYFWRRTVAARHAQQAAAGTLPDTANPALFVPVQVVTAATTPLEVVLGRDRVVRVPAGFDAVTLRQLLAVLEEEASC